MNGNNDIKAFWYRIAGLLMENLKEKQQSMLNKLQLTHNWSITWGFLRLVLHNWASLFTCNATLAAHKRSSCTHQCTRELTGELGKYVYRSWILRDWEVQASMINAQTLSWYSKQINKVSRKLRCAATANWATMPQWYVQWQKAWENAPLGLQTRTIPRWDMMESARWSRSLIIAN